MGLQQLFNVIFGITLMHIVMSHLYETNESRHGGHVTVRLGPSGGETFFRTWSPKAQLI